jgi:PAS domain S-box-containing protein
VSEVEELRRRIEELESELRSLRMFEKAPYRAVIEDMTEMIVRWRPDGTRVFVNDAYCRLFGATREELIGTSFWPLVSDQDREEVEERIRNLCIEQPVSTGRHRSRGAGGHIVWTEWCDRALYDADGGVLEYQSVGRDISERVRLEEKLRQIERAEAQSRASATIAHDLGNVLTVLSAVIETSAAAKVDVTAGRAALAHGTGLLRQLSRFGSASSWRPVSVDLNERIAQAAGLLRELAGVHAHLELDLTGATCTIQGDPLQIDQILLNLVRNAAQASDGSVHIKISTDRAAPTALAPDHHWAGTPPPECCVLRVADDAGGISPSIVRHMFEPHVTTKADGQGLGLTTVKAIADSHSASIRVETSNRGTRIELAFPAI